MDRKFRSAAVATALAAVLVVPATAAAKPKTKTKTVTVYAGGPVKWATKLQNSYGAGVNNFLINKVTINAGDTVTWNGASLANGFHTVDIPAKGGSDLPLFVPTTTPPTMVTGVTDAANNPFWFNGKVPIIGFNPALFGPTGGNVYNGSSRVDSGVPGSKPTDFKVTFTKPGTYHYFCDVHYGMEGTIVVRPTGKSVPNTKRDANVLKAEEQHYVAEARAANKTKPGKNSVSLGASAPGGLEVFKMFPVKGLSVKVGTTVRFEMSKFTRETHTATFGPTAYVNNLVNEFGPPTPTPIGIYPSDPAHIVLTSASHGNGFANTGVLDRDGGTPQGASNTITFDEKGTYTFICLIHPFMHGTITVK